MAFLRRQGTQARYVTSVCNGSLVLGAAGLLRGYHSAGHWMWRHHLASFGATPVAERVVKDRNRIFGGGVTAGIDFDSGTPEKAGPELVARLRPQGPSRDKAVRPAYASPMPHRVALLVFPDFQPREFRARTGVTPTKAVHHAPRSATGTLLAPRA